VWVIVSKHMCAMYISVSKILCAGSIDSTGNYNCVIIEGVLWYFVLCNEESW